MASAQEGESPDSAGEEDATVNRAEGPTSTKESSQPAPAEEEASGSAEEEASGSAEEEASGSAEEGHASNRSMAKAIEDVSSLPGETVNDQDGRKIGQVKEIYAVGDGATPMWVTVESSTGIGRTRDLFVPLARLKNQNDELRVPYSFDHIHESPEVDAEDEISDEDDRALRAYYGIGLGDQELVQAAQSYASQVPEEDGSARKVEAGEVDGPAREIDDTPPGERVAQAYEKQKEEEGEEHRKGRDATAEDVFQEDGTGDGGSDKASGDEEKEASAEEEKASEDEGERRRDDEENSA